MPGKQGTELLKQIKETYPNVIVLMITAVDTRLREEADRYQLRFACEHCAHRDAGGECSLGYPAEPRRADALQRQDQVRFCKTFELE